MKKKGYLIILDCCADCPSYVSGLCEISQNFVGEDGTDAYSEFPVWCPLADEECDEEK